MIRPPAIPSTPVRRPRVVVPALLALLGLAACAPPPPSSSPTPSSDDAGRSYVGALTHPLPEGVEELQGAMIGFPEDTLHAVTHLRTADGEMLWLGRMVERLPDGVAVFRVVAEQPLPERAAGEAVLIAVCRVDGTDDDAVAAVADVPPDAEVWTDVRAAWRADRAGGRFVAVDASRVSCVNHGDPS